MKAKRTALKNHIETILKAFDTDYRVTDRFNRETLVSTSRAKREKIMGKGTTYAEVLYEPAVATSPTAGATWTNKKHRFLVRVWYGFSDNSQDVWDEITEGDNGLLIGLESTSKLGSFTLFNPTEPLQAIRFMDGKGTDLAHYLEFMVEVR